MPDGFPDCPGCHRCGLPGLNLVSGFPDCRGLNLVFFAIAFRSEIGCSAYTLPPLREADCRCRTGGPRYPQLADTEPAALPDIRAGGTCLVCASFGSTELGNTDSARRCRFRNSQQKRASDLDPTYVWIPKLDVAGSSPVSRSMFSMTCTNPFHPVLRLCSDHITCRLFSSPYSA